MWNKLFFAVVALVVFCSAVLGIAQVRIAAPVQGTPVLVGSSIAIRWQGAEGAAVSLWYSIDNKATWVLIERRITASEYQWVVPDIPADSIAFRVERVTGGGVTPLRVIQNAHPGEIRTAKFAPDGRTIVSGGREGFIKVWDVTSGSLLRAEGVPNGGAMYAVRFSHSGDTVFANQLDDVWRWDTKGSSIVPMGLVLQQDSVRTIDVHQGRNLVATAGATGVVRVWDAATRQLLNTLRYTPAVLYTVAFSHDGSKVAFAGDDGKLNVWEWEDSNRLHSFSQHGSGTANLVVWSCAFAPRDSLLASGGVDGTVRLWESKKPGSPHTALFQHNQHVRSVAFSPDGRRILSGSLDATIRQWDAEYHEQIGDSLNHGGQVIAVDYSPTGDTILSAGRDGAIILWKSGLLEVSRDTAVYRLGREIVLEIPHLAGAAGTGLYIPLLWRNRTAFSEFLAASGTASIELPPVLVEVVPGGSVLEHRRGTTRDTVLVPIRVNIPGDTIAVIPARILLGVPTRQDIRIIGVEWSPNNRLLPRVVDGSITVADSCYLQPKQVVGFSRGSGFLSIYPNPASEEAEIVVALATDEQPVLSVFTAQGQQLLRLENFAHKAGEYTLRLPVSHWPTGEYFVRLHTTAHQYSARLTVVR